MPRKRKPLKPVPPCSCHEHTTDENTPTVIGRHTYWCYTDDRGWWRWECRGCNSKGQFQGQSPSCSYHSWLKHVERQQKKDALPVPYGGPGPVHTADCPEMMNTIHDTCPPGPKTCRVCGNSTADTMMAYRGTDLCCGRCDSINRERSQ